MAGVGSAAEVLRDIDQPLGDAFGILAPEQLQWPKWRKTMAKLSTSIWHIKFCAKRELALASALHGAPRLEYRLVAGPAQPIRRGREPICSSIARSTEATGAGGLLSIAQAVPPPAPSLDTPLKTFSI